MTATTVWLADQNSFSTYTDAYTMRNQDGNPVGLPHKSQSSGSNVKVLSTTDVKFNVNSLAVAKANSAKIQALIDALPDSGGCIGIPHDLALTTIKLPTRTIRGIPGQPINFRLYGTRPGVQIYGMSTDPLFTLVSGPSGVVHTPTRTALIELRDLGITCRGTGIDVTGAGLYFTADNVEVRSESGPAWRFQECYGMHLGRVGAYNSWSGTGFLFDSCIHVSFNHLWSRTNKIGLEVANTVHRSGNFFGAWDIEGNSDWQIKLDGLQKSNIGLYMEGPKRMSLKSCENLQFVGDGLRAEATGYEIDSTSRLMNPALFETELVRVPDIGIAYTSYNPKPITVTGENTWYYEWDSANAGHWVDIAHKFPEKEQLGHVFDVRFRVRGTGSGYFQWQGQNSIPVTLTGDWQEIAIEREPARTTNARLFWFGNVGCQTDFELVHIGEVVPRRNYCI